MPKDPLFDNHAHLKTFPDHVLFDIARNGSAQHDYRKLSVEILLARKSPKVKHEELKPFVDELNVELDGIVFDHPPSGPGPLSASVTTTSIFGSEPAKTDANVNFTGFDFPEIPQEAFDVLTELQHKQEEISGATPKKEKPDAP